MNVRSTRLAVVLPLTVLVLAVAGLMPAPAQDGAGTTSTLLTKVMSSVAPASADAAVVRSYRDGPVLYLSKWETRVAGKSSSAAAIAFLAAAGGPAWAGAGAAAASIADSYIEWQVSRGYCLLAKMWWWNPRWLKIQWYSWWPCR